MRRLSVFLVLLEIGVLSGGHADAQMGTLGSAERLDAAQQATLLGIQQAISSLPPPTGQLYDLEYDADLGVLVATKQVGPTALLSPATLEAGKVSVRLSGSYFHLSKTLRPITYDVDRPVTDSVTAFGVDLGANVGIINVAAAYGITDGFEGFLSIPIVIVEQQFSQQFPRNDGNGRVQLFPDTETGRAELDRVVSGESITIPNGSTVSLASLRSTGLGTGVGLGRISLGGKYAMPINQYVTLAAAPAIFLPSPSEDELSGTDSFSMLFRGAVGVKILSELGWLTDGGYEYDVDFDTLSRFVWNTGLTYGTTRFSVDVGIGGSIYDQGIEWTPRTFDAGVDGETVTFTVEDSDQAKLGTNLIDFKFGTKVLLAEGWALSGAVSVPVNEDGLRPIAVGTVGIEAYF